MLFSHKVPLNHDEITKYDKVVYLSWLVYGGLSVYYDGLPSSLKTKI